jgi:hypothetical protein
MVGPGGFAGKKGEDPQDQLGKDDMDTFDIKKDLFDRNQKEVEEYNKRMAKIAQHEAKVAEHKAQKKQQKEVEKLKRQQGKKDKQAKKIVDATGGNQEDHKGKGGGKTKPEGHPMNKDKINKVVEQKLQNDVDNKDLQKQTEDYMDYAVLGIGACVVLLFVYFAARG